MATIKAYTTIEQSRKLAEILPLESADMYYFRQIDNDYFPPDVESIYPLPLYKDGKEDFNYDIRCWSLAALLSVLPSATLDSSNNHRYRVYFVERFTEWHDNAIDACYEMILKLNELKLL